MLFLESEDPEKDINIYINSPGGDITALFAIYDTLKYVRPTIDILFWTSGVGSAVLLAAVPREAVRSSTRSDPPPSALRCGGGQASDIELQAKEILRMRTS